MENTSIDKVLELISDKTDVLHTTYEEYSKDEVFEEQANECLSQITVLNELYEEVKQLKENV